MLSSCQSFRSSASSSATKISRVAQDPEPYTIVRKRTPKTLSFQELVSMVEKPKSSGAKRCFEKAQQLFASPYIDNSHYYQRGLPEPHVYEQLGPCLRVSSWNIEKSIQTKEVAGMLTSLETFRSQLAPEVLEDEKLYEEVLRQRERLIHTDILFLQEMDLGHRRSDYLFAAQYLARELDMNFVYAPQQLEIDPVYLGLENVHFPNEEIEPDAGHSLAGKPSDYKGLFGVAVLSRYPIKRVKVFQLKTPTYDWYLDEIKKPDFVEITRRDTSEGLFHVRPAREVKYGGRGFTRVDLHVPGVPHETISVINVHLEIKTTPKNRAEQVREILSYVKDIKNPVIMAGDFNSVSRDISSTSLARFTSRTASDPTFIFSAALFTANVTGVNQLRGILNGYKNHRNPLAVDIPVILPNKSKELFNVVRDFRFSDGGAFDFRGDRKRSIHWTRSNLANSNQRHPLKGYTYTFEVPRPIGPLGRERLDWIFVKSFLTKPSSRRGSYQLAPHFGETLDLLNKTVSEAYSDHHPITVLLPLEER